MGGVSTTPCLFVSKISSKTGQNWFPSGGFLKEYFGFLKDALCHSWRQWTQLILILLS